MFKKNKLYVYYLNINNRIRYGSSAPKFAERIWVEPHECIWSLSPDTVKKYTGGLGSRLASGRVITSSWPAADFNLNLYDCLGLDFNTNDWNEGIPIEYIRKFKFKFCFEHWVKGIPWEDTGVYDFMLRVIYTSKDKSWDGCSNIDDIKKRYENLDRVYEQVKKEGKFRIPEEVDLDNSWIESESIMHVGPGGEPFFGGSGVHRFAIASILEMSYPAIIGLVHVSAIPYLHKYRGNGDNPNRLL